MELKRLVIDIPKEMHTYLKLLAVHGNTTMRDIVTEIINEKIEKDKE